MSSLLFTAVHVICSWFATKFMNNIWGIYGRGRCVRLDNYITKYSHFANYWWTVLVHGLHLTCNFVAYSRTIITLCSYLSYLWQIDYSISEFMKDEDAYHVMPLHTFASIALHNFMDWVGIEHFTGLAEDLPEFIQTPLLKNLVNSYRIQVLYTNLYTACYFLW